MEYVIDVGISEMRSQVGDKLFKNISIWKEKKWRNLKYTFVGINNYSSKTLIFSFFKKIRFTTLKSDQPYDK